MKLQHIFINTNQQKIFNFLAHHLEKSLSESEIVKKTKISTGGVHQAVKKLAHAGLISVEGQRRQTRYFADSDNPIIKQWKILSSVINLNFLLKQLKDKTEKIILFGSAAEGTNLEDSDIDIFILTKIPDKIRKIMENSLIAEKIQLVIKKPQDFLNFKKKNSLFYREIEKGIILWEK